MNVNPPHVIFNIPSYGGIKLDFLKGFLSFTDFALDNGIAYDIEFTKGCSAIALARSLLFSQAMVQPNWTHMMWIDDDIGFNPEDIMMLIAHDKDFICGNYPTKEITKDKKGGVTYTPLKNGYEDKNIKEIKYAPTGFMLLTRKLCEDMISNYSDLTFQFWRSQKLLNYPLIDVFGTMLYKDPTKPKDELPLYLTEDYAFCRRALDIGYKIYLSKKVNLKHIGDHAYESK